MTAHVLPRMAVRGNLVQPPLELIAVSRPDVAIEFALGKPGWFEERFLPKTVFDPVFGCRLWRGGFTAQGYGVISVTPPGWRAVPLLAHRVAFAQHYGLGKLPQGRRGVSRNNLVVDHKCNNPCCVEPTHLRAIPTYLNRARGFERRDHPWQIGA